MGVCVWICSQRPKSWCVDPLLEDADMDEEAQHIYYTLKDDFQQSKQEGAKPILEVTYKLTLPSLINPLKYSQPHQPLPSPFSPPLGGLTITAYSAGHTLGGTIWHIQHGMESVVYAVDWNQAREHVLSGAAWLGGPGTGGAEVLEQLRRPTALICSSKNYGLAAIAGQLHAPFQQAGFQSVSATDGGSCCMT